MEQFEVLHVDFLETIILVYIKFKEKTIKTTFRLAYPAKVWKMTDFLFMESMEKNDTLHHVLAVMEMEEEGTWNTFQKQILSLEKEILQHKKIRIKRLFIK